MRWHRTNTVVLGLGAILGAHAPALAVVRNDGSIGDPGAYPFAVKIGDAAEFYCSGTVIAGGTHVITAQHCMTAGTDAGAYRVMQDDGTVRTGVGTVALHPIYDVAIIRLDAPITDSVSLFTGDDEVGREIAFAGYGQSSTTPGMGFADLPYGTKRVGANVIDFIGTSSNTIGFDFDLAGGVGTGGLGDREATTMTGDSGAGYLAETAPGIFSLLGVHAGISPNLPNRDQTFSFGVRVSTITDWIGANVPSPGAAATLALGLLPLAGRRRRA